MTAPLTAVSAFAGIGGFDLAFARADVKTVATIEVDKKARGVLADQFPDAHHFADIRDVTSDDLRSIGFVPERGILFAGFPCQDLSIAGRRYGMGEGTRSGLFWELDRLVGELAPRWIVLENVPGLLSSVCPCPGDGACRSRGVDECPGSLHRVKGGACDGGCHDTHGGTMGAVLGAVASRGYGFAYRVLDARYFGVPQRRARVFIVGRHADNGVRPASVLLEPEAGDGDSATRPQTWTRLAGASRPGARRVYRKSKRAMTADDHETWIDDGVANTLNAFDTGEVRATELIVDPDAPARRFTPTEVERLQGFPDGWTTSSNGRPQSDTARVIQLGNAVAVPVAEWIAHRLVTIDRQANE